MAILKFYTDFQRRLKTALKGDDAIPIQGSNSSKDLQYVVLDDLKEYISSIEEDIPSSALAVNLTSLNSVFDINNYLLPSGLPSDIKVINTYTVGKIRLFKLTDATENKNITVYFDKISTKNTAIELFDIDGVFISSTSFASGDTVALFYNSSTDEWTLTPVSKSTTSDVYTYSDVGQTAEIKWYKGLARGLGFKIGGWGFSYTGFKRLVGQTLERAADGINWMRYHTDSLLKLFIQGKEVFIADSVATQVKRVSKYTAEEVDPYTGWTEGAIIPNDTFRLIDNSFTTEELAYEISLSHYAYGNYYRVRLFDHTLSSDDDRKHYQAGGVYYRKTGQMSYYIENDTVIGGGNDPTNTKSFFEAKQGNKQVLAAGYGKPGGAPAPTPLSADDPHEQYMFLRDGKERVVISCENEDVRKIYSKNGDVAQYWDDNKMYYPRDIVVKGVVVNPYKYIIINQDNISGANPKNITFPFQYKVLSVTLGAQASNIHIDIGASNFDKDSIINEIVPANTTVVITGIDIVVGQTQADVCIKIEIL